MRRKARAVVKKIKTAARAYIWQMVVVSGHHFTKIVRGLKKK